MNRIFKSLKVFDIRLKGGATLNYGCREDTLSRVASMVTSLFVNVCNYNTWHNSILAIDDSVQHSEIAVRSRECENYEG